MRKRPSSSCISLFSSKLFSTGKTFRSAFSRPSSTRILPSVAARTAHFSKTKKTVLERNIYYVSHEILLKKNLQILCKTSQIFIRINKIHRSSDHEEWQAIVLTVLYIHELDFYLVTVTQNGEREKNQFWCLVLTGKKNIADIDIY